MQFCKLKELVGGTSLAERRISEKARNFVFQHIDSVELLETLFLFHQHPERTWDAAAVAQELRSTESSIKKRLQTLRNLHLIETTDAANHFRYQTKDVGRQKIVEDLLQVYREQRHRILEIIFSPIKKARDFADAFRVSGSKKEGDDND